MCVHVFTALPDANSHRAGEGCSVLEGVCLLVNPWKNSGQSICYIYVQHDVFCPAPGSDKLSKVKGSANFRGFFNFIFSVLRVVQCKARLLNSLHHRVSLLSEGSSQTPCNNFMLMKLFQPLQLGSPSNNAFSVSP